LVSRTTSAYTVLLRALRENLATNKFCSAILASY
jgi:hypothetical protein